LDIRRMRRSEILSITESLEDETFQPNQREGIVNITKK